MKISLQPITKQNYEAVCELDVTDEQEEYVACNMWSIVESKFNEDYETRAIYQDKEPVGFFMWVKESTHAYSGKLEHLFWFFREHLNPQRIN